MSAARLVATRSTLLRARAQLDRVRRGADAVSRKRQALVGQLFRIARPAIDARAEIAVRVNEAAAVLVDALAANGMDAVRTVGLPARELTVDVTPCHIWGVPVADVEPTERVRRTLEARGTTAASAGPALTAAADAYEALADVLIAAAPRELRVTRLAEAVASTSRQLRLLRERVEPRLVAQIGGVARTLEEREREEHLRLKHLQRRLGAG